MHQEELGLLFIKHCNNFRRLSGEHLQAIKEDADDRIIELAAQKQIIMDSMMALQGQFDINDCSSDTREKAKELLSQIIINQNEGQQITSERSTRISKKMLANRKELNIHNAYEEQSFQNRGILCNIEK